MSKFLPTSGYKWINPEEFYLNRYTSNSLKKIVLEVDLNILKSYKNCTMISLAPNKIEIKREILPEYH